MTFTNYKNDSQGFGVITGSKDGSRKVSYAKLELGKPTDSFDVNNARSVVVVESGPHAGKYAFDSAWNIPILEIPDHNHFFEKDSPYAAGSTIGVIVDPLGPNPRLVAATEPIPAGFPHDLAISPDGKHLYATFGGVQVTGDKGSVLVYDIDEIDKTVRTTDANILNRIPITVLNDRLMSAFHRATERKRSVWQIGGITRGLGLQSVAVRANGQLGDIIRIDLGAPQKAGAISNLIWRRSEMEALLLSRRRPERTRRRPTSFAGVAISWDRRTQINRYFISRAEISDKDLETIRQGKPLSARTAVGTFSFEENGSSRYGKPLSSSRLQQDIVGLNSRNPSAATVSMTLSDVYHVQQRLRLLWLPCSRWSAPIEQ